MKRSAYIECVIVAGVECNLSLGVSPVVNGLFKV